jgi:hypothetical protein
MTIGKEKPQWWFGYTNMITNIMFLGIIHRPVHISKHKFSETGFSLRLLVKPTQLGQINRASRYLRTPVSATR